MESLLATYASSDEEDEREESTQTNISSSPKISTLLSSLPKPQSSGSSIFSSLPSPKPQKHNFPSLPKPPLMEDESRLPDNSNNSSKARTLFFSLPSPKSGSSSLSSPNLSFPDPNPKRLVQFKPPVPQVSSNIDDEDEDGEDEERERKRTRSLPQDTSVKSFLSSIPAPKNSATLGALPMSGTGRRSIVETEALKAIPDDAGATNHMVSKHAESVSAGVSQLADSTGWVHTDQSYPGYDNYSNNFGDYAAYQSVGYSDSYQSSGHSESYQTSGYSDTCWSSESSATMVPETTGSIEPVFPVSLKKGNNRMPAEIVEVNQDELMKNRPRQDQAKLTGIAFGPSYQPVSAKGKPTKLHKRKHQIGSLYFDMKQKEMELAERRSKGFLTKAETQAKYGW